MNSDVIADLKQFITATVFQGTTDIRDEIRRLDLKIDDLSDSVHEDIKNLDGKIDDLSESVAEAISTSNEATDSKFKNHEHRITKLEKKAV